MLLPLLGENLLLNGMIRQEAAETRRIQKHVAHSEELVGDLEQALDRVIEAAERPVCADTVLRMLAGLPAGIQVKELVVLLDEQREVKLEAKVRAGSARATQRDTGSVGGARASQF